MRKIISILKRDLKKSYITRKMSTYQIAEYYGYSQATIWKLLHKYNICLRKVGNRLVMPYSVLKGLYVDKKLSSRKIAKIYNCAYSAIDRRIKEYGFKIRNRAQAHMVYARRSFSGNLFEKAYLIGFAKGDLRVRKIYKYSETIVIDCASTIPEQIKLIKDLFEPYGRVWVSKMDRKGRRQIQAQLDLSFDFLFNLDDQIDYWILNNKDYFLLFLAGFTDAEGSFFISGGKASYSLGNYNKKILYEIYQKLTQLGICCPQPRSDNKKGHRDKQGYIRRQSYWTLRVNRKQSLAYLFELLGHHLRHSKRKADMEKAKRNIIMRNIKFGESTDILYKK